MNKPFIVPVAPLFVPGDRPDLFAKAAASGADAIIIDLEDAIAPQSKESARKAACRHDISSVPVILRINGAGMAWHADDLAALLGSRYCCCHTAQIGGISPANYLLTIVPFIFFFHGVDRLPRMGLAEGARAPVWRALIRLVFAIIGMSRVAVFWIWHGLQRS